MLITHARLLQLLSYQTETGIFTWNERKTYFSKPGQDAGGAANNEGYRRIGLDGKRYFAHRLAWFYVHAEWPKNDIDHINRDRADNRIANLREATRSQNLQNRTIPDSNTSGVKGVYWHKGAGKWVAQIKTLGAVRYLGLFSDLGAAQVAREMAEAQMHTHRPSC